jgi:hypothetical protein
MLMSRWAVVRSAPSFGRRVQALVPGHRQAALSSVASDLRLFALTFAGGFLFVSVYLA